VGNRTVRHHAGSRAFLLLGRISCEIIASIYASMETMDE
jgi:hypothetical protein